MFSLATELGQSKNETSMLRNASARTCADLCTKAWGIRAVPLGDFQRPPYREKGDDPELATVQHRSSAGSGDGRCLRRDARREGLLPMSCHVEPQEMDNLNA